MVWPQGEGPREKLMQFGAGRLSDAELLALFLRTGIRGVHVLDLAQSLLNEFNGLANLARAEVQDLCRVHGLGQAKAVQIKAVLALAERVFSAELSQSEAITSPQQAERLLRSLLVHKRHEHFVVLYLNNQHQFLGYQELFQGGIDGAAVYPRVVVERVLAMGANAVIVAHNHPSGLAEPSQEDKIITRKLARALGLIDVTLLDHLSLAGNKLISLAQRGELW